MGYATRETSLHTASRHARFAASIIALLAMHTHTHKHFVEKKTTLFFLLRTSSHTQTLFLAIFYNFLIALDWVKFCSTESFLKQHFFSSSNSFLLKKNFFFSQKNYKRIVACLAGRYFSRGSCNQLAPSWTPRRELCIGERKNCSLSLALAQFSGRNLQGIKARALANTPFTHIHSQERSVSRVVCSLLLIFSLLCAAAAAPLCPKILSLSRAFAQLAGAIVSSAIFNLVQSQIFLLMVIYILFLPRKSLDKLYAVQSFFFFRKLLKRKYFLLIRICLRSSACTYKTLLAKG